MDEVVCVKAVKNNIQQTIWVFLGGGGGSGVTGLTCEAHGGVKDTSGLIVNAQRIVGECPCLSMWVNVSLSVSGCVWERVCMRACVFVSERVCACA